MNAFLAPDPTRPLPAAEQSRWDTRAELKTLKMRLEEIKKRLYQISDTLPADNHVEDAGRLVEDAADSVWRQMCRLDEGEE